MGLQIAAALVGNDEIDVFTDQVLEFVTVATAKVAATFAAASGALERSKSQESKNKTQELALLDAVKAWIKRNHAEKPVKTGTASTNIWGGTTWNQPTEAELHKDRVKAMGQALEDVDSFANIPALDAHVRSLVFELSRCHFFKGSPTTVLKTLCATAGRKGGFGLRSTAMTDQLAEKASAVVKEIVSQVLSNPQLIDDCLKLVTTSLPPLESELGTQMLHSLAITMSSFESEQTPTLSSILKREQQWSSIFCSYSLDPGLWNKSNPLGQVLGHVYRTLSQVGDIVTNEGIGLRHLHTVLDSSESFLDLCKLLSIETVSQDIIISRRAGLNQFDSLLRETQCYVSFFCSCGVPIEATVLKEEVGKITAGYDAIAFGDIEGAFSEVPAKDHIPWLFALQSSELFLATFRKVGAQVCSDIVDASRLKASRYEHPEKLIALFQAQLAADRAEPEPVAVAETPEGLAGGGSIVEDEELMALNEELESYLEMEEAEDDDEQADRDAEIRELRMAIEQRREELLSQRPPPRPVLRRNPELRPADVRVGTKVMALADMEAAVQFEQGEVSAVNMSDDGSGPLEFVVQWFSSGAMSTIDALQVNVQFTAYQMSERLAQCLTIGRDNALSDGDKDEQMKASLAGTLVIPLTVAPSGTDDIIEGIILTQQQVADVLLPKVKQEWSALFNSIKDQVITTAELHQQFSRLETSKRCKAELKLLASTGEGQVSSAAEPDWLAEVMQKLDDFLLSERLQRWIPAILAVRTMMDDLFKIKEDDDSSVVKVRTFYETVQQQWDQQVLGTLSTLVEPVKEMFHRFSAGQLDFLASLADNEALMQWLLEHDDTDAFNSLLQVCRPRTEDPLLLKAIASLVQIRTLLLDLLYLAPPFNVFGQMLDSVLKIDMARGATMQHLETAQNSFEGLIELFEKETRSPGIKSCYDLDEIRNDGVFVLKACGEKSLVLLLRLPNKKDTAVKAEAGEPEPEVESSTEPEAETDAASGDAQYRWEGAEYLEDLRSKLIMTDLPEEVEAEIPDLKEMIEKFSEQLQLLSDMRDALFELYTSGHFAFQGGYEELHHFKPTDGLPALQLSLKSLQFKIDEWNLTQQNARDQFYYLNYYTKREILRKLELLVARIPMEHALC